MTRRPITGSPLIRLRYSMLLVVAAATVSGALCSDGNSTGLPFYFNTSDPANNGATYVGSAACSACHSNIASRSESHGHTSALSTIRGAAPAFPTSALNAGVPNPPDGFDWNEIAYVIGGHSKGANFVNDDGFILTTGLTGIPTQWNLLLPASGTNAGFADFEPTATEPLPFDHSCFKCHVTGAQSQDPSAPEFQDGRPGIAGTWAEAGVQCESCHGPGSNHIPNTAARNLFVDPTGASSCNQCHSRSSGSIDGGIVAIDRFIAGYQQHSELLASGGHAEFKCTICHDPHASTVYSPDKGIRNACTACHTTDNMALHEGKVFTRGDYTENLSCESCHMPYATKTASSASAAIVGNEARMGDTRTHIFRIRTEQVGVDGMLDSEGSRVLLDDRNRAAVSVDFVCLRCHNGNGAFELSVQSAGDIVGQMHRDFSP
ncbi:MAG: hypothetical protein IPK83_22655 [Planctomycetes bacterium]|nr:hypothetical protein [Planctomycetota bacterium]